MKKVIFGLFVMTLMFATSCKKSSNPSFSWTIKGTTYNQTTCTPVSALGELNAYSTSPASTLYLTFFNNTLPTASNTFTVSNNPTAANQVYVEFFNTSTGADYTATGNGTGQTLAVTVSSAGKISATGTNIQVANTTTGTDTTTLNLNIAQQ